MVYYLGLPVQHIFCCCTFLPFELIDENRPVSRPPILTSVAAGDAHKISTDIRPLVPHFYRGQNVQKFGQISTPIVFGPPYFWTAALCRKTNTNLSCPMIGLPPYQTRGRWVPPTLRTVGAMGTQKGKSGNFLYILRSSGPRSTGALQYYTTNGATGCAHKISTDSWPTMPPPFFAGANVQKCWPIVFRPPYFWTAAFYRKPKTNLSRAGDRPITTPNLG